jgi:hypothetical protein
MGALPLIWIVTNGLGWSFPALVPIVTAAAGLLGFEQISRLPQRSLLRGQLNPKLANLRMIEISLERTEVISERLARDQDLMFQKEDLLLIFHRDERGHFAIRIIGPRTKTHLLLEHLGREFARLVIRKYTLQQITEELERRGLSIAEVGLSDAGEQQIIVRKW